MTTTTPQTTTLTLVDTEALDAAVNSVQTLEASLNSAFFERRAEIRSLIIALVARQHVLLLGPPGTGKSALTNALTAALGGDAFSTLFTKFTTPEEVFGPISLKGLENDVYRRVTNGFLPSCDVAFLDEIFKANSAILNSLLTVINERLFNDNGHRVPIPLQIVVGASNELPEEGEGLEALFDRFTLRHWVTGIKDENNFEALLNMTGEPLVAATLSNEDLETLRAGAQAVDISGIVDKFVALRKALSEKLGMTPSDRRWRKAVGLVRAAAVLTGRTVATGTDMMILAESLWEAPEDRAAIFGILAEIVSPDLHKALALLDAATELYSRVISPTSGADEIRALAAANGELKKIIAEVSTLTEVDEVLEKVTGMQQDVARRAKAKLGID